MARVLSAPEVYTVAANWRDRCVANDDSYFWPGTRAWTVTNIDELLDAYMGHPDHSKESFLKKWQGQLAGRSADVHRVAADVLAFYYLFTSHVKPATKAEKIKQVASWGLPGALPSEGLLQSTFVESIGGPGAHYNFSLPWQTAFYLQFAKQAKVDQADILDVNQCTKAADHALELVPEATEARQILLHLLFPDRFEPIASVHDKELIRNRFSDLATPGASLDDSLLDIRDGLSATHHDGFTFYSPGLKELWKGSAPSSKPEFPEGTQQLSDEPGWEEFVRWAARFYNRNDFEKEERIYKIEIADRLREAKQAFEARASDWIERLVKAFGPPNNLTSWQMHARFLAWVKAEPGAASRALPLIWNDSDTDRISGFLEQLPVAVEKGKGSRTSLASFLQMGLGEATWPFYKPTVARKGYQMAGYARPDASLSARALYEHFLGLLDVFIDEARQRDLDIKDRLDAQGLLWCVVAGDPVAEWSAADREEFLRYRDGVRNHDTESLSDLKRFSELLGRHGADPDRLWMVVQGSSYQLEHSEGTLRAPQVGTDGRPRAFWTAMTELAEDDVLLHYANSAFRAVGVVTQPAQAVEYVSKPGNSSPGWMVQVEYHDLKPPVPIGSIPTDWRIDEDGFTSGGVVRQGYLFRLSHNLATKLLGRAAPSDDSEPEPAMTFQELVDRTLWTETALKELIEALQTDSYQVVLAGPPGTGKTWLAQELVKYLTGAQPGRTKMVQFHPSYSYEQFIEGLRPVVNDANAISFERVDGIALSFAKQIHKGDPDHFLIIDEMNRANLPRVLGELMFLFEYRNRHIDLPYTSDFSLPRELRFIGTMNTADRSIRSIDVALRRRFDVFECLPDGAILSRYYAQDGHSNSVADLPEGFERLNGMLTDDLDKFHTIGHTFFMTPDMTPLKLRMIWHRKLLPLIEEYFFDRPARVSAYGLDALWPSIA